MPARTLYQVLLLPSGEVVARHQSLAEASAWVHTYHEALGPTKARDQVRAVIAEEAAEPARLLAPPRVAA